MKKRNLCLIIFILLITISSVNGYEIVGPDGPIEGPKPNDIVCEIGIHSVINAPVESSSYMGSIQISLIGVHSFITLKNISYIEFSVANYILGAHEQISIGTYGNLSPKNGVWINTELYDMGKLTLGNDIISLKKKITMNDITVIDRNIKKNDLWELKKNCTSFSLIIWNTVLNDDLKGYDANVFVKADTPKKLFQSISERNHKIYGIDLPYSSNFGYFVGYQYVDYISKEGIRK